MRPWIRPFIHFISWSLISVVLGLLIGIFSVILSPTASFGVVGAAVVIMLWVMPDDTRLAPSITFARTLLSVAVAVNICVPGYYAFAVPGLPWISFRRLALFPLVATVSFLIAASPDARLQLKRVCLSTPWITFCALAFAAAAFMSIFISSFPAESLARFVNLVLEWYLPAVAVVLTVRSERDFKGLIKLIAVCSLVVSLAGILEFVLERRYLLELLPKSMFEALAEANPTVAALAGAIPYRNGMYRASSVYSVSLSFGEFVAMTFPFALHYIAYGRDGWARFGGVVLCVIALLGIFASGARGGYVSLLAAAPVFFTLWLIREVTSNPRSLMPAITGAIGFQIAVLVVLAIIFWKRAHNLVFGDGMAEYSTQARFEEWNLAIPHIWDSPLLGNGFGIGAEVVKFFDIGSSVPTLDSSIISVLVEVGGIGFGGFFGMLVVGIILPARSFLIGSIPFSEYGAAFASSFVAFATYRTALSQNDNHFTLFLVVAAFMTLHARLAEPVSEAPKASSSIIVRDRPLQRRFE